MDFTMTKERWEALSDADRAVMKSLGMEFKEVTKEKKSKVTNPITLERIKSTKTTCPEEEYYLRLVKVCGCCKTEEVLYGRMMQAKPTHKHLSFVQMPIPLGEHFRQRRYVAVDCPCCLDVLGSLEPKELAKMIIGLHQRDARRLVL